MESTSGVGASHQQLPVVAVSIPLSSFFSFLSHTITLFLLLLYLFRSRDASEKG
jgi:hypothetical protein